MKSRRTSVAHEIGSSTNPSLIGKQTSGEARNNIRISVSPVTLELRVEATIIDLHCWCSPPQLESLTAGFCRIEVATISGAPTTSLVYQLVPHEHVGIVRAITLLFAITVRFAAAIRENIIGAAPHQRLVRFRRFTQSTLRKSGKQHGQ